MEKFCVKDTFYLNDAPFQVISGSMHYFRVLPEYWLDRLKKLKNMGCNVVETYIPWNLHEKEKGQFDFSYMLDIEHFVHLAQEVGLYVILRPSPYICAEWEFGGLPYWLLKEDMRLRCRDERFLKHVFAYYDALFARLVPLQVTHGGAVIMMQVENEYGSYGNDREYLEILADYMRKKGVDVPLMTSDGPGHDMMAFGQVEGAVRTANFGSRTDEAFDFLQTLGIKLLMCTEFWNGWFDHWGGEHHKTAKEKVCAELERMLDRGHVNFYMFHGGTSFGFMNGSNSNGALMPDVTSYDYDAPVSEDGQLTEKYFAYQACMEKHLGHKIEQLPLDTIKRCAYQNVQQQNAIALFDAIDEKDYVHNLFPLSMEQLGQGYGYTLYRVFVTEEQEIWQIELTGARDRASIFIDEQYVTTLYDNELDTPYRLDTPLSVKRGSTVHVLVENMGRVNYGWRIEKQKKGIDGNIILNGHIVYDVDMLCLDEQRLLEYAQKQKGEKCGAPSFYQFTVEVNQKADTFVQIEGSKKGNVFINNFNLGRYDHVGPQERLYLPAPLLKEGENLLTVFEAEGEGTLKVSFFDTPKLEK